jgi:hypothetical protein
LDTDVDVDERGGEIRREMAKFRRPVHFISRLIFNHFTAPHIPTAPLRLFHLIFDASLLAKP